MYVYYLRLKVLHVEDDPGVARTVERLLRQGATTYADVVVHGAPTLQEGLQELQGASTWDAVLLDLGLPDSDGIETFHQVHGTTDLPIVVLTAEPDLEVRSSVIAAGAQDCIYKAELTPDVLIRSLRFAIERHHQIREMQETLREVDGLRRALGDLLRRRGH